MSKTYSGVMSKTYPKDQREPGIISDVFINEEDHCIYLSGARKPRPSGRG